MISTMKTFLSSLLSLGVVGEKIPIGNLGFGAMDGHSAQVWYYTWVKQLATIPGISIAAVHAESRAKGTDIRLLTGKEMADLHRRVTENADDDNKVTLCCFPGGDDPTCGTRNEQAWAVSHPGLGGYSFMEGEGTLPTSDDSGDSGWQLAVLLTVNCGERQYDEINNKVDPENTFWSSIQEDFPEITPTIALEDAEVRIFDPDRKGYWLPAYELATYNMYSIFFCFYFVVAAWWYLKCKANASHIYDIHGCITLIIVVSLGECIFLVLAFAHWDISGRQWRSMKFLATFAQAAKQIFSALVILAVSMGYSVTRPNLPSGTMSKMILLAIAWCVSSAMRNHLLPSNYLLRDWETVEVGYVPSYVPLITSEILCALVMSIVAFWIQTALTENMEILSEGSNTDHPKLRLFKLMQSCFIGGIVVGFALFICIPLVTGMWSHSESESTNDLLSLRRHWYNDPVWILSVCTHTMAAGILLAIINFFMPGKAANADFAHYQTLDGIQGSKVDAVDDDDDDLEIGGDDDDDFTLASTKELGNNTASLEMTSKVGKSSTVAAEE